MSPKLVVVGLYVLIVASLGLIVRWEYRLIQKRKPPKPAGATEGHQRENSLPVD
jgi:hypothetical protein